MTDEEHIRLVAERIRAFRKELNLTQADVASKMNIEVPNYRRLESGRHIPSFKTLLKVSAAFNVPVQDLLLPPNELMMVQKLRELPTELQNEVPNIDWKKDKTVAHADRISEGKRS